jgi:hypothetical protein
MLMGVYVVDTPLVYSVRTCRASAYHNTVFRGKTRFEPEDRVLWYRAPALTNTGRDLPHVTRSGRFIPPVFYGRGEWIVSQEVKDKLSVLKNVDFLPVVFETLVDLELPGVGDFSWEEHARRSRKPAGQIYTVHEMLPDVPELHKNVGAYYYLLLPVIWALAERYDDVRVYNVPVSHYPDTGPEEVRLLAKMMKEYSIVDQGCVCLRADAFAVIAPYLNLDSFTISWIAHL